eukprot:2794122-Rhodomonas_salina.2
MADAGCSAQVAFCFPGACLLVGCAAQTYLIFDYKDDMQASEPLLVQGLVSRPQVLRRWRCLCLALPLPPRASLASARARTTLGMCCDALKLLCLVWKLTCPVFHFVCARLSCRLGAASSSSPSGSPSS